MLFQISGAAALAGASGAAWMYFGGHRFSAAGTAPSSPYPFDPIRAENFQQKLFIPGTQQQHEFSAFHLRP